MLCEEVVSNLGVYLPYAPPKKPSCFTMVVIINYNQSTLIKSSVHDLPTTIITRSFVQDLTSNLNFFLPKQSKKNCLSDV